MSFRTKILATLALFMVLVSSLVSVVMITDVTRRARREEERTAALLSGLAYDFTRANAPAFDRMISGADGWTGLGRLTGSSKLIDGITVISRDTKTGRQSFTVRGSSSGTAELSLDEQNLLVATLGTEKASPKYERGSVYLRLNDRTNPDWAARIDFAPSALPPADVGSAVREVISVMLLGAVILLLVVYVMLNRLVLRPIDALSEASARIALGDFSRPAATTASYDEVNRMVESFNFMMERLGAATRKLNEEVRVAEARASTTERRLVVAQRLSTAGSLAAGVAHEINNPLGGLINAAAALRDGDMDEAKRAEYLELIADGLNRMREIVGQLLKFTPRPYDKRPTDIRDVTLRALALAEHRFKERTVRLQYAPPASLPTVHVDAAEVQQAVLNVVLNALDAVEPERGVVTVDLREADGGVEVSIRDNGCGIDEQQMAHCLDPFFTTKAQGQGSGIGLAVVQTIVSNHDGQLSIESDGSVGTTFVLYFPAGAPQEKPIRVSTGGNA